MTGWRLGWLALPEDMAERVKKLAENLFVSPPTISQHIAYKIFDHMDVLDGYVRQYRQNRDILLKGFPEAGFTKLSKAAGAFYLYADIGHLTKDSEAFCKRLLNEAGVAITPGLDFDSKRGKTTARIAYAGAPAEMEEACARLKAWMAKAA
jgi:aspartate/methionine/tyrosine aminotransferase